MNTDKAWRTGKSWTDARSLVLGARRIVVLTGAGISAESGIPTFRDKDTGFWQHYSIEQLATPQGFQRDKALVWGWYTWRRRQLALARPNPGHLALAALASRCEDLLIVTQNVDDLHERAGSPAVVHLHGELYRSRCFDCDTPQGFSADDLAQIDAIDLQGSHRDAAPRIDPPACNQCGGALRPDVVWFGESLPESSWLAAEAALLRCDLVLCVGTSGLVYPAAALPATARKSGIPIIQVNPHESAVDDQAHINLRGLAGEVLPALFAESD